MVLQCDCRLGDSQDSFWLCMFLVEEALGCLHLATYHGCLRSLDELSTVMVVLHACMYCAAAYGPTDYAHGYSRIVTGEHSVPFSSQFVCRWSDFFSLTNESLLVNVAPVVRGVGTVETRISRHSMNNQGCG